MSHQQDQNPEEETPTNNSGMEAMANNKSENGGVTDNGCGTESFEEINPGSSDGIGVSKPGRKRNGPMEKVIENRQKKMVKNRESAAQSRVRKHAYTIELEAELNHLRDANAKLRHRLNTKAAKAKTQARAKEKLGLLRRCLSSPF